MKKSVLLSILCLSILVLASFGFSGSSSVNEGFVPVEKGKTYKIFVGNQTVKITILEEPKGNWVKADIKNDVRGKGIYYLNLNQVFAVSSE